MENHCHLPVAASSTRLLLLTMCAVAILHAQESGSPYDALPTGFDIRRVISAKELAQVILRTPGTTIRDLRISDRWTALESGTQVVRFENCAFDGGIKFNRGVYDAEFTFTLCTFSLPLEQRGVDMHIAGVHFLRRLSFFECGFPTALRIADSDFAEGLSAVNCTFSGRVVADGVGFGGPTEFLQSRFEHDASFEEVRATDRMSFYGAELVSALTIQNGTYSAGIDLSSLSLKPTGRVSLKGTSVRGELLLVRSFRRQVAPGKSLEIHPTTRLESIIGLSWNDFRHAYSGSTPLEYLAVLPVLRQSLQSQGLQEDTAKAYVELRHQKAIAGTRFDRMLDGFMRYSSDWGTRGTGLVGSFFGVWVVFAIVYSFVLGRLTAQKWSAFPRTFAGHFFSAVVLSFRITFLQGDEQHFGYAAEGLVLSGKARRWVHRLILVHSAAAAALLLMLASYVGAQFSAA